MPDKQVVSSKRVADYGEVFTADREVNAMLDLVKPETERIDSRFLEPACGKGAFLTKILERKLRVVKSNYAKSIKEYKLNSIIAVSSIYGIDILPDNVKDCRQILFEIYEQSFEQVLSKKCDDKHLDIVKFLLSKNIIWGDALSLKQVDKTDEPIIFSEWSFMKNKVKRRDYSFKELLNEQDDLFSKKEYSDIGNQAFIPIPVQEFPLIHYLGIKDADKL